MRALKAATAVHHERLERRVDIESRLRSPASYRALLERFYGFYAPLEPRLAPYVPLRLKTPLLEADIAALGGGVSGLPVARRVPGVGSSREALGVLYVLEGATLGGAVIARLARRSLGVTAESGAAFFGAYGREVGARWRAFGALVEREGAACAAAVACFEDMERWLCE